jgi:hypothetical protein
MDCTRRPNARKVRPAHPVRQAGPDWRSGDKAFTLPPVKKAVCRLLNGALFTALALGAVRSWASGVTERWVYCPVNLQVSQNATNLVALMTRAAASGYTHILISDSKFGHLGDLPAVYFQNVGKIKAAAARLNLEIVPAVFPIGYSNDILFQDPNLVEGLPVVDTLLSVTNGAATVAASPAVSFPGGDFSNLAQWTWKDSTVVADNGTAKVANPNGANSRIVQTLKVAPFRQYHVSVQVKTTAFPVAPNVAVISASGQTLNFANLGVQPTQDWTTHHVVFNSLSNSTVSVYFGVWGGTTGSLWWDNAVIEETAFVNLIRRPGAPLSIRIDGGAALTEGTDFTTLVDPLMGTQPWNGSYDVYHSPPTLHVNAPNGSRVRASWHHAITVYDGQAMICPSEPKTMALLRDQATRMHAIWGASGYFMSHDEIRVMNWCAACQARHLDAGPMLATNVQDCISILRSVNPNGRIYVWSDMFDPNHNAHGNYYLVRGNLAGSWLGLDPGVIIVPWNYDQRANSLKFFADRGHRQMIAGYYDAAPSQITNWLAAATPFPGVVGAMYTTWANNYSNLETFAGYLTNFPAPPAWRTPRLRASVEGSNFQLNLEGERGQAYTIRQSQDLAGWSVLTNLTAASETMAVSAGPPAPVRFFEATTSP